MTRAETSDATPGDVLRRFAMPPAAPEQCELCSAELAAEHQHLVEVATRQIVCACDACAILFGYQDDLKYRRVPRQIRALEDFRMTDVAWNGLGIPIGLVFFFHSSPAGRTVAIYPSPAGPTESQLGLDSWDEIAADNPIVGDMEPDVEALLLHRVGSAEEYYIAPIDQCYKLVGMIRAHWQGLSGGKEVWGHVGQFFAELKRRAKPTQTKQS